MHNPSDTSTGLYYHIPFCKKACHYCNFHFSTSLQLKNDLVEALLKEIDLTGGKMNREIRTIYFGGGTPSILLRKELRVLMEKTNSAFRIDPVAEISFEANPDDMSEDRLSFWKSQGINRLSVGVQSFRDEDLEWMNRAHKTSQSLEALRLAKDAGFSNISIDLIYGIPGLSDKAWQENIERAISLGLTHISAYALTVEPRTALDTMIRQGKKAVIDADQQARQFILLMDMLEAAGYEHYEISNFARPGMRSRHNSAYWQGVPYFGFGPGAHSYDGFSRYWNISNNPRYVESIGNGIIPYEKEELTAIQKLNEYTMTAVRTMEGISLQWVRDNWGAEFAEKLLSRSDVYAGRDLLTRQDEHLRLTRKGKLFADGIASALFQ